MRDDRDAEVKAPSRIGLYLCGFLMVNYSLVKWYIGGLAKENLGRVYNSTARENDGASTSTGGSDTNTRRKGGRSGGKCTISSLADGMTFRQWYSCVCSALGSIDRVIGGSLLALVLGAVAPVRNLLASKPTPGALSWIMTAIVQAGKLVPTLSLLILGGVLYNTRRTAPTRQAVSRHRRCRRPQEGMPHMRLQRQ